MPWPPVHRCAYGLDTPLDGNANAVVRPYVLESERKRERQHQRRRLALVLTADLGIDLDRHVVGANGVA
ncbi:hypothetical protein [Streptomyces albiflavescens]|nr:hypothetical protein [Streptomyces albiflavescens]